MPSKKIVFPALTAFTLLIVATLVHLLMEPPPAGDETAIMAEAHERMEANPSVGTGPDTHPPVDAESPKAEREPSQVAGELAYAGQPLAPVSAASARHEAWPEAELLSVWEGPVPDGQTRRVTLVQPRELPYPVRIEEILTPDAELVQRTEMVANRFVLRVEEHAVESLEAFAARTNATLRKIGNKGIYRVDLSSVTPDGVPMAIREAEENLEYLLYAEADDIIRILRTPNDESYADGTQWNLHNTGQDDGVVDADIDAPEAWDIRNSAAEVIIAIVDTGINFTHEDLADNLWVNQGEVGPDGLGNDKSTNGIDDDGNGFIDDVHGINAVLENGNPLDDNRHGSHVGGTAAAKGNNGVGISGVAWEAKLMALKLFDANGAGSSLDAIVLMQYAIDHGAKISNHSWAGDIYRQSMKDMIDEALEAGHLVVAAAGNSGLDNDVNNTFPADYESPNILSVAAFDRNDELADFTNFGSGSVHLAAPGVQITAPDHRGVSDYQRLSGSHP